MLTDAEIRRKLETTIESLGEDPIQVEFPFYSMDERLNSSWKPYLRWFSLTKDVRIVVRLVINSYVCCFVLDYIFQVSFSLKIGDPRLMDDMCHKEKTLGHIGKLEQRFPKAHVVATFAAG